MSNACPRDMLLHVGDEIEPRSEDAFAQGRAEGFDLQQQLLPQVFGVVLPRPLDALDPVLLALALRLRLPHDDIARPLVNLAVGVATDAHELTTEA